MRITIWNVSLFLATLDSKTTFLFDAAPAGLCTVNLKLGRNDPKDWEAVQGFSNAMHKISLHLRCCYPCIIRGDPIIRVQLQRSIKDERNDLTCKVEERPPFGGSKRFRYIKVTNPLNAGTQTHPTLLLAQLCPKSPDIGCLNGDSTHR